MKIQTILILAISLIAVKGFGQKGEPVILNVIYQFKHVNDLNKPSKPYQEEMILHLGKTESRYNSWTEELKFKNPTPIKSSGGGGGSSGSANKSSGSFGFIPMVFVDSKGVQDFDLLQQPAAAKLIRIVKLGSYNYLVESKLPTINWKLYEEKKEILGYSCQKAVGSYAGRTYIAWFAPSLPFKCGPWKLSGLPGLILEAVDAKAEVSFLAKELNKSDSEESTAARITIIVRVSEKDLNRATVAFEDDPIAVSQSQMPIGSTATAQITFIDEKGNFHGGGEGRKLFEAYRKDLKQQKRNPLELTKSN
ncbi:GLPGLI family protein [Pedobacter sp. UYEF25]